MRRLSAHCLLPMFCLLVLTLLAACGTRITVDKRVQLQFQDAQFPERVTVDAGEGGASGAVADATGETPSGAVATSPGGKEVAAHSLRGLINVNARYTSATTTEDVTQELRGALEAAASVAAGQGTTAGDSGTGDTGESPDDQP